MRWIKELINGIKIERRLKHIENTIRKGEISGEERKKIRAELQEMDPIILSGFKKLHPETKRRLRETGIVENVERILSGK